MKKTIHISILLISSMITNQVQCSRPLGKVQKATIALGAIGITSAFGLNKYQEFQQEQTVTQENRSKTNCQDLQGALNIAIAARQAGHKDILTAVPVQLPYSQKELVACRKNYEEQHPDVFQKNPAIIIHAGNGLILINVMDRQEADEFAKQIHQEQAESQKRN